MAEPREHMDYPQKRFHYERVFNPQRTPAPHRELALQGGDRPKSPYSYDEDIILAVNTALVANRPLLVGGPPGTGKSSLAADVARQIADVPLEAKVITSRTEGRDLLWRFDTVRRLRDAHLAASGAHADAASKVDDKFEYLNKGVLWNAFDASRDKQRAVVLIDEIDKADSDVPNSLLEVLGNGRFRCDDLDADDPDAVVEIDREHPPFIIITTNDERELSRPFRRRCVVLNLRPPSAERLLEIATAQGLAIDEDDRKLAKRLADEIEQTAEVQQAWGEATPNAAEYLDALRACLTLDIDLTSDAWPALREATLRKSPYTRPGAP
jgi:MoxR-like ATPase